MADPAKILSLPKNYLYIRNKDGGKAAKMCLLKYQFTDIPLYKWKWF